jgi:hypothetical protein
VFSSDHAWQLARHGQIAADEKSRAGSQIPTAPSNRTSSVMKVRAVKCDDASVRDDILIAMPRRIPK